MVTFATLFLGLLVGPRPVELVVADPVVAVEIRLDGHEVATLEGPPWTVDIDLGDRLLPHHLEAVGRDASGVEVDRVEQWVNLPRSRVEASLVVESDAEGQLVRLVWASLGANRPRGVRMSFDGQILSPIDPERYRLPEYDASRLHVITAELAFRDGALIRVDTAIGGALGEETSVEMTGIPVRSERGRTPPDEGDVRDALRLRGDPVRVVASETERRDLVVVMDPSAWEHIAVYSRVLDDSPAVATHPDVQLDDGESVRFISTIPTREGETDLFPVSQPFGREQGRMDQLLTHATHGERMGAPKVADAVATAGVQAAAGGHPRAVLLVVGPDKTDESGFEIAEVRAYLEALRVPLIVWSAETPPTRQMAARLPFEVKTDWGRASNIYSPNRIIESIGRVRDVLDSQRVLWVEGGHLPQEFSLTDLRGVSLAD